MVEMAIFIVLFVQLNQDKSHTVQVCQPHSPIFFPADDALAEGVAGEVERGRAGPAGGGEQLDLLSRRQRVIGARRYAVRPSACRLVDHVAGAVDEIFVGAAQSVHRIGAAAAAEDVVAVIALDGLAEGVAGEVERGRAGVAGGGEQLDVLGGFQRVAHGREHAVGAGVQCFVDHIAGAVDEVFVGAAQSVHRIGAAAAGDGVCTGIAVDRLVEGVAGEVERPGPDVAGGGEQLDLLPRA